MAPFLVLEERLDIQLEGSGGNPESPFRRINCFLVRRLPSILYINHEVVRRKFRHASVGFDEHPVAEGVGAAVAAPELIEHQLAAVGEVQREPVPSHLVASERAGAPLPIEPSLAGDLEVAPGSRQAAGHRHARIGVVVGRVAGLRVLAAVSLVTVEQRPFARTEVELDSRRPFPRPQAGGEFTGAGASSSRSSPRSRPGTARPAPPPGRERPGCSARRREIAGPRHR